MQDLIDVKNGTLLPFLNRITGIFKCTNLIHPSNYNYYYFPFFLAGLFSDHITNCVLCKAKGFVCEICNNDKIILFPFEEQASVCPKCEGAFHRQCFKSQEESESECVRCVRLRARKAMKKAIKTSIDEDYSD